MQFQMDTANIQMSFFLEMVIISNSVDTISTFISQSNKDRDMSIGLSPSTYLYTHSLT